MEFISHSVEETERFAEKFARSLKAGDTVLFTGEMGAGKTAFTRGVAKAFGCSDVTSPTFALVNEYRTEIPVFHFDLYRISGFEELYSIGFFDYLDRGGIILVEWSENVPELSGELDAPIFVEIKKLSENERKITVTGLDVESLCAE